MQTPNTFTLWLFDQALPLVLVAGFLALLIALLSYSSRRRATRTKTGRVEEQAVFMEYLVRYGFDATISLTTYRYLQTRLQGSLPLRAHDLLEQDLGFSRAEVRETVADLMRINGRSFQPGGESLNILTVEDLIRAVQAAPWVTGLAA